MFAKMNCKKIERKTWASSIKGIQIPILLPVVNRDEWINDCCFLLLFLFRKPDYNNKLARKRCDQYLFSMMKNKHFDFSIFQCDAFTQSVIFLIKLLVDI